MNINPQHGFTLIELMIVIAIIGILAAIALPMYQDHISKTQITRVYYELSSTKAAIEHILSNGHLPTLVPSEDNKIINNAYREYLGLNESMPQSNLIYTASIQINNADNTFTGISATIGKNAYPGIKDSVITLTRSHAGEWSCEITKKGPDWKNKFMPPACKAA